MQAVGANDDKGLTRHYAATQHRQQEGRSRCLWRSIERDVDTDLAATQWQARVDLAAAHRLAVMHGLHEGIFNHLTLRVPGTDDRYYQIPFGLHWSEVTASCFMEVGYDGTLLAGEGEIERSSYCIHAPMHRLLPHGAAVFHTHMPYASALARLEDQRILPIGQTELGIDDGDRLRRHLRRAGVRSGGGRAAGRC